MAINRYTTWVDLACASTTGIVVHDIVTGADSGAVGIVWKVTNNSKFTVLMISGTFDDSGSGGEVITNQDSDSCTITNRVATTETTPTNGVIVTGDNTASTDIFRDIRDASNTGGWALHTDPDATDQRLYLDAYIWLGRKDQAASTSCISKNEIVDILTDDVLNYITVVGNSTYGSTLKIGDAKYVSDNETNFPPRRYWNGDHLTAYLQAVDYGELKVYNTDLYGKSNTSGGLFLLTNSSGLIAGLVLRDTDYSTFGSDDFKVADMTITNKTIVLGAAGIEWHRCVIANPVSDWTLFLASIIAEGIISDTELLGDDDLPVGNYGAFFSDATVHLNNCSVKSVINLALVAGCLLLDEKSFDLEVLDENKNAISSATVTLTDKDGYSAFYRDSGETLTANATDVAATITVSDGSTFSTGDIIRLDNEKMLITNIATNTLTVTRSYQGTTARAHNSGRIVWVVDSSITTDANGKTTQYYVPIYQAYKTDTTNTTKTFSPFDLTISKSGYKTYKSRFNIGDATNTSYKCDIINCKITLEKVKDTNMSKFININTQ